MSQDNISALPALPEVCPGALKKDPKAAVKSILGQGHEWFKNACDAGCDALEICRARTQLIDNIILPLFEIAEEKLTAKNPRLSNRAAILAMGGYGRMEMGLFSDVDILFLYEGPIDEYITRIAESIYYPLWDNNIEVNSATRTLSECIALGKKDVRTMTSLLDARFLAGDFARSHRLDDEIRKEFSSRRRLKQFICAKLEEQKNRLKRYGDSISLVEPNVKEGEGGLRDFHTLWWAARASFPDREMNSLLDRTGLSAADQKELIKGVNFLWRIRHALHLLENRKNDRLGREQQGQVAQALGLQHDLFLSITEQLMQEYYRHASVVHLNSQRAVERIMEINFPRPLWKTLWTRRKLADGIYKEGGRISASADALKKGPSPILNLFCLAHENRLSLDAKTKGLIMDFSLTIDTGAFDDPLTRILWKKILSRIDFLHRVLEDMLECKCIEKWIPEMKPIIHRVQHDGYHFYTIEEHSIRAIQEMEMLLSEEGRKLFPTPAQVLSKVKRTHVLTLAVLLHDIGKGEGRNHAEKGTEIAGEVAKRMGFDEKDCEAVAFLIKSHLLLPKLAYRRDIKDPHLIARLADTVGTAEILDMLYLLAFADIRSIGPNVWSDWKGGLLTEVYQNTLAYIENREEEGERRRAISLKKDRVNDILGGAIPYEILSSFFSSMPGRYLLTTSPESIAAHLAMTAKLPGKSVILEARQPSERGFTELSIVTRDAPGLFSKIAGVLSINGVNIIDAQLYTLPDGTVLDLLWVTNLLNEPLEDTHAWKEIERGLESAISGSADIHKLMKRRTKRRFLTEAKKKYTPLIDIDNDVSVGETVVDVITNDRPGLLYEISKIFFDLGCTIERAKITTHLDQVIDVFYIRDASKEKITSRERLKQIQEAITKAIA
jgi:[protein-PII] uridylyltransferase